MNPITNTIMELSQQNKPMQPMQPIQPIKSSQIIDNHNSNSHAFIPGYSLELRKFIIYL